MSYKGHIVVVEDDALLRKAIINCYQKNNYHTTDFESAKGVAEFIERRSSSQLPVDVIVTDIVLPDKNGYELIGSLRSQPNLGKIFISINSNLEDKIKGFHLGADDYIVKPLDSTELLLRTQALLLRIKTLPAVSLHDDPNANINFLNFQVNPESRILRYKNQLVELGYSEHQLLLLMISQQGNVISKQQIATHVYSELEQTSSRNIDKLVSRLRVKLNKVGGNFDYIITQRGKGYLLMAQV